MAQGERADRRFSSHRWAEIVLRCAHLVGVAGMAGGWLFELDTARWLPYAYLTLSSGLAMSLLAICSHPAWPRQLKGLTILLKLGLLGLALLCPSYRAELFVTVIVLSGVMSHAPGWVRGADWWRSIRRR